MKKFFIQVGVGLLLAFVTLTSNLQAKDYDYAELLLKDLEEMEDAVRAILKVEGDVKAQAGEALKLIFSRPDNDNLREKVLPYVRSNLPSPEDLEALEIKLVD